MHDGHVHPYDEFLSLAAASVVWNHMGVSGLVTPDRLPVPGDRFHDGNVGYHLHDGGHELAPRSWMMFLDFFLQE